MRVEQAMVPYRMMETVRLHIPQKLQKTNEQESTAHRLIEMMEKALLATCIR